MKPMDIMSKINEGYELGTMTEKDFQHICDLLGVSTLNAFGGIIRFEKVDIDTIKKLVDEELIDENMKQNNSPSVKEMIDFSETPGIGDVTVDGYIVVPSRDDSRVTLDGFNCGYSIVSKDDVEEFLETADEKKIEDGYAEAWWD